MSTTDITMTKIRLSYQ